MMTFASFSIEKPQILPAILLILPAIIFVFAKFKRIEKSTASSGAENQKFFRSLKRSLFLRTFFRCTAWIFAVLAFSEISFGSKKVSVQKSGSNVSFVFDISYSMLAKDAPSNLTRLDAAKIYTTALTEQLESSSFSAILAKGDGFTAIPETEDKNAMLNLIQNLSPALMTSSGSSLGKGIEAALNAIPPHSAKSQYIWVFTDGDETDSLLEKSLEKAVKLGVPVTIVGFGSEREIEITAGDGKTRVKTALRAKKLQEITESTNKINSTLIVKDSRCSYIDSKSQGSAWHLLNQVKRTEGEDDSTLAYEVHNVNRHGFFIFLSLIFLMLSFVAGEWKAKNFISALIVVPLLTSCSYEKKQVLDGVWAWYEGKYTSATADFLNMAQESKKDSLAHEYAVFNLSSTYLALGENDAAFNRLSELNLEGIIMTAELKSAAYYNMGIICSRKSDYKQASYYFKKAIVADSKNLNAKINLELCERELVQKQAEAGQAQMQGVNEEKQKNPEMKNEIFDLIRENEGKKWRNMQQPGGNDENEIDF